MQTLEFITFWLLAVNCVTFLLFGYDKMQARSGGWRVSEEALMLWVIAGGILGALAGRNLFRHKTRKASFTTKMWSGALINLCFVGSLFAMWTQDGDSHREPIDRSAPLDIGDR